MTRIRDIALIVGMEVHVELSTRTKMFSGAPNPAAPGSDHPDPNSLLDPVVLGLPGALPTLNARAVEMAVRVGLALGCSAAGRTKWDRKSYFYPDMPKNYQISQYDLPVCFDGSVDVPRGPETDETFRVGIIRAHLEEDAGKLLHELPGGGPASRIDHSIVDLNRAGTPLLEIVTAPDMTSADEAVAFAVMLRNLCRSLGVTEGVMQQGHMRFEPNINCILTLDDGRKVRTPIVEIKNLNSFRSVRAAIEFERREQPRRWEEDGREMGPGAKSTRGWDDEKMLSFLQREKEDAHDYRYFPEPDLLPVDLDPAWVAGLKAGLPEAPHRRERRYRAELGLGAKEAAALVEEPATCAYFEECLSHIAAASPTDREAAGRIAANLVLQTGFRLANERTTTVERLGVRPERVAAIAMLRHAGSIPASGADRLFVELTGTDEEPGVLAERLGVMIVRDDAAMEQWVREAIDDPANAGAVADLQAGKQQAIGRIVGAVMKRSGGKADAAAAREMILRAVNAS
jgi:aspartyl-tRNA(Asn)/glutamyl-tRNA(Gln) amidotransferase subunit B